MKPEQQTALAKPFAFEEHGFIKSTDGGSGTVYIRKSAIRRRLSAVDPHWRLSEPEFVCVDGDVVIMRGSLTVCGVTRFQIGTAIIQRTDKKGVLEGYSLAKSIAKAYKAAASDILPRAAIEFNVAAYLKDADSGKKPTTEAALKAFLDNLNKAEVTHWAQSGGRERVMEMLKLLGTDWNAINSLIEPDKMLATLSETTLTEAEFMKRLVELTVKPAQPKAAAANPLPSIDTRIICPMTLIEEGDAILQESKSQTQGTARTFLKVLRYYGKVASQYKLDLQDMTTGTIKPVFWSGSDQTLVDGPKVKRYLEDPSICRKTPAGLVWDSQPARV